MPERTGLSTIPENEVPIQTNIIIADAEIPRKTNLGI